MWTSSQQQHQSTCRRLAFSAWQQSCYNGPVAQARSDVRSISAGHGLVPKATHRDMLCKFVRWALGAAGIPPRPSPSPLVEQWQQRRSLKEESTSFSGLSWPLQPSNARKATASCHVPPKGWDMDCVIGSVSLTPVAGAWFVTTEHQLYQPSRCGLPLLHIKRVPSKIIQAIKKRGAGSSTAC